MLAINDRKNVAFVCVTHRQYLLLGLKCSCHTALPGYFLLAQRGSSTRFASILRIHHRELQS